MANNARTNPMQVDTASDARLCSGNTVLTISNIMVVPGGASWVAQLENEAGDVIFYSDENSGVPVISTPFNTVGLVVATLTTCTLLIHTLPSANA